MKRFKTYSVLFLSLVLSTSCISDLAENKPIALNRINEVIPPTKEVELELDDLNDTSTFCLIELESVNTHHFSEERLKEEKEKINNILLSDKYFDWENPTSGGAVHITRDDKIEVYNSTIALKASRTVAKNIEIKNLWLNVQGITFGNSPSVLITSELDLRQSKSFKLVVEDLFEHGPRIFYLQKKEKN